MQMVVSEEGPQTGPPDAHFQLASQMEADSPPALVDGMSSPALMLLEFQRDARNHFTAQVAEVVEGLIQAVCQKGSKEGAAVRELFQWRPSVRDRRDLMERVFRLQIRREVQAVRPSWLTRRDSASVVQFADNHRRGVVRYTGLQQPKTGFRPQQQRLLAVQTRTELQEVVAERRMEIVTALSDGYLRVRVAVLRTWIHFCVEGAGVSPWRVHWPADQGDDELMSDYLASLSLRYTDFGVVDASFTHVLEFHKGFLRVSPPPLEIARWTRSKIKRLLAIEFPLGRKVRPGLTMQHIQAICSKLMGLALDKAVSLSRRQHYVNSGAAIAATYSPALRTGETCPGEAWNPRDYWSRMTIASMCDVRGLARADVESVLVRAMKRKTVYISAVAREKANLPILYDAKASHSAAFARWGPLLVAIDPCSPAEMSCTPAFREGGPHSDALSTTHLRETIRAVAESCIPDWEDFDYGMHSLRIGREAAFRVANVRPELINDITSHTAIGGRAPYSRIERTELLSANREADAAVVKPLETAVVFTADRAAGQQAVYISSRGDVAPIASDPPAKRQKVVDVRSFFKPHPA